MKDPVLYYVNKFGQKMIGSTFTQAWDWVQGIGDLSNEQKVITWNNIRKFHYPTFNITLTKKFINGNLKGLTCDFQITVPNEKLIPDYLKRYKKYVKDKTILGGKGFGSPYIITEVKL